VKLAIVIAARGGGKSRLAPLLDAAGRAELEAAMLADMLDRLVAWPRHVVTPSPTLKAVARASGAAILTDPGEGLNGAFAAARAGLGGAMLAMPGDLPAVTDGDVATMAALLAPDRVIVVPTGDGGTGAVLLPPGMPFAFAFGPDSFARHRAGPVTPIALPGLSLDIDTPADADAFLRLSVPGRTREVLTAAIGSAR
jgi:2-phospho-L-lactate/phosphoenolpyruvate guanylyltransferase